jgi:hypothetical protein|tara:strand:- start:259 stop:951 length:693 start_codon:yes stop_codon:yes gene_type:complete
MADVDAYGQIIMANGAVIPLFRADLAEAAEEEIFTDTNFVGSAQNAGTYATQTLGNVRMVSAGVNAENDMSYCYIRSAGTIKAALPVSGLNSGAGLPAPLPYAKALVSGDQAIAMANATSDREVALSVACSNGEYHVFSVTPSGAAEHELVSVLTGLGVGETLQGRVVTHAFAMGGNNSANFSSPIYFVNGSGVPIGSVTPNDPAVDTGTYSACRAQIALNTRAVFRTDA